MDLYHIPNDNGIDYRLKKFVEYQHEVPSIHYRFAGEWARRKAFVKARMIQLCWYLSVTYNEITAILLDELVNNRQMSVSEIWERFGDKLNFGSARKYAKYNGRFLAIMNAWDKLTLKSPFLWLNSIASNEPYSNYGIISEAVQQIPNVGRFASDIFLEGIAYLQDDIGIPICEPCMINWDAGANLTSGIFNIFYLDEKAQEFEQGRKLTHEDKVLLGKCLSEIQSEIHKTYPEQDSQIQSFIGKICSFRNLFKKSRYGGFHHDRQLGVLRMYQSELPEYDYLWRECFYLRRELFPEHLLGEVYGWDGIRPERKKLWLQEGLTGVENDIRNTKL